MRDKKNMEYKKVYVIASKIGMALALCACCGCAAIQSISPEVVDNPSEERKQKIRDEFRKEIERLTISKDQQTEYRVLIVNWADVNNESLDFFMIVRGLANGGEIWLNSHAADVIDGGWREFGNANYEGTFRTLPALINWIGRYGWRLIEVHDSRIGSTNFPDKLYFVKKIVEPSRMSSNNRDKNGK